MFIFITWCMLERPQVSRTEMLRSMNGAEKGATYWLDEVSPSIPTHTRNIRSFLQANYFKASAYRLELLQEDGNMAIDGERFPFEGYYAEVHPGLGTVLSMNGRYAVDFTLGPPSSA